MPESRKRKESKAQRKKRGGARRSGSPEEPVARAVADLVHPPRYSVGRLRGSEKAVAMLLDAESHPDRLVELLPPLLWLYHVAGMPANQCVNGCMVLKHAYTTFGIRAEPTAVDLTITDRSTDAAPVFYGRADPYWDWESSTFHGHCALWLPRSGRLLDATVEQYPEMPRRSPQESCLRAPISGSSAATCCCSTRPPGSSIAASSTASCPPGSMSRPGGRGGIWRVMR